MVKIFSGILLIGASIFANAQYASINAILTKLEERKGINQNLSEVNIDDKKFVLIKDSQDHTERDFIIIKVKNATYV